MAGAQLGQIDSHNIVARQHVAGETVISNFNKKGK